MAQRYLNLSMILLMVPTLIGFRLWNIQIQNGEKFRDEAKHIRAHTKIAARGAIMTTDGLTLAVDRGVWDLFVVFRKFDENQELALHNLNVLLASVKEQRYHTDLLNNIDFSRQKMEKLKIKELKLSNKKKLSNYLKKLIAGQAHLLFKNVPAAIWVPLKTRPQDFPGFTIKMRTRRVYPQGQFAAHVIGRMGLFSQEDSKTNPYYLDLILKKKMSHFFIVTDPTLQGTVFYPHDSKGRNGIELQYQDQLRGINGCQVESKQIINGERRTRTIEELSVEPTMGWPLYLTINSRLQRLCEESLAESCDIRGGSIVIMNSKTGAIQAMASNPSFDADHITREQIHDRLRKPLTNKCLEMQLTPASVFKIVTSIAILESGVATPHTQVNCHTGGFTAKGSKTQHCWHVNYGYSGHGPQRIDQAIANSCNMYYYYKGTQLGWERLTHWAKLFGFGRKTGIDLPREFKGQLVPKRGPGSGITNFSIGQGNLQVTPLQVATFMSTVANRGYQVTPYLVSQKASKQPGYISVSDSTWKAIEEGMRLTVMEGTAKQFTALQKYNVLAKTGTAQAGRNKDGSKKAAHLWFTGHWTHKGETYAFAISFINAYKYIKKDGTETSAAGALASILSKYYEH